MEEPRPRDEIMPTLAKHRLTDGAYLLVVATQEPRKNLARLARAYAALPAALRARHPLVIAGGRGWLNDELERAIAPLESRGEARRLGYVDEADLPALYAGAYAFAFPSLYEGFGLPLIEVATTRSRAGQFSAAAVNSFGHMRNLADHRARAVTTPNNDTLYTNAWLDLGAQAVHGKPYAQLDVGAQAALRAQLKAEYRGNGLQAGDTLVVSERRAQAMAQTAQYYDRLFADDPSLVKSREHFAMKENTLPSAERIRPAPRWRPCRTSTTTGTTAA